MKFQLQWTFKMSRLNFDFRKFKIQITFELRDRHSAFII